MFTFLNSLLLLALPAALLPILIHLFTRQKVKTVPFSSLTFLKNLQRQRMKLLKLYQWLLLIIRTLAVLFIILAFARPALKGVFTAGIGARTASTVVIALDNSLSMGADTRQGVLFDLAKARARELLRLLKPEDSVHLIVFSDRISFINEEPTHNIKWLEDIITRTRLTGRSTDVKPVLTAARALMDRARDLNREIYLLTDLTANGWETVETDSAGPALLTASLFCFHFTPDAPAENCAVTASVLENQILAAGQQVRVKAGVANFGPEPAENLPVRMEINGRRMNETAVSLVPGEKKTVVLPALVEAPGWYNGTITIADDALAADNLRHFTFEVPDNIPVLIVGSTHSKPSDEDVRYLRYALEPAPGRRSLVRVTTIRSRNLARYTLAGYRVVIFSNVAAFSSTDQYALKQYYGTGGSMVFFLGDRADLNGYNRLFKSLGTARITALHGTPEDRESFSRFSTFSYDHPLFKGLIDRNTRIDAPKIYAYYRLRTTLKEKKLIRFADREPALVESGNGRGRIFIFPFGTGSGAGDFAVKASFVPIIYRIVQYSASDLTGRDRTGVGDTYRTAVRLSGQVEKLICRNPEGEVYSLPAVTRKGETLIDFKDTHRTGIYTVSAKGQELRRFAVNPDPKESRTERLSEKGMEERLSVAKLRFIGPQEDLAKAIAQTRYGREVFTEVLWIVCLLLACEMAIAWNRKRIRQEK